MAEHDRIRGGSEVEDNPKPDSIAEKMKALWNDKSNKFMRLASKGKLAKLHDFLGNLELTSFDLNCTDSTGRTALELAIINGHPKVVKLLLFGDVVKGHAVKLNDALFHAIDVESLRIVHLLLEKDPQTSLRIAAGTASKFAVGTNPIMLAALKNNYNIIKLLFRYKHALPELPKEVEVAKDRISWDSVTEKLQYYEAISSPAYMLLMYNECGQEWDPLIKSIELYGKLKRMARRENEVSERYIKAAKKCEKFALSLLESVRSAKELSGLMRFVLDEDELSGDGNADEYFYQTKQKSLLAISEACDSKMKNFVTSDNAQLSLMYVYRGKMFRTYTGWKGIVAQVLIGLMFPFLSIVQLVLPKSYVGRLSKNPTVKYWSHVMSKLLFIAILISNTILSTGRDQPIPRLLTVAYFWILGTLVQEIKELWRGASIREYLKSAWNWNDLGCIVFYSGYMIMRVMYFSRRRPDTLDRFLHEYDVLWFENAYGLLPISDIFIGVAYIFVFMRILELMQASRLFGPLQLSLNRMAQDAFMFLILFSVFFFAFGTSITQIFLPYGTDMGCSCKEIDSCQQVNYSDLIPISSDLLPNKSIEYDDCEIITPCKDEGEADQLFTSLTGTLYGLFWALFGYGNNDSWVKMNCPEKRYITWAGSLILGAYHFCGIVVLLNMLIAMMSSSFQKTSDNSETEWKFHRTLLWLNYIHGDVNRPPPMNLLPNVAAIVAAVRIWFKKHQNRRDNDSAAKLETRRDEVKVVQVSEVAETKLSDDADDERGSFPTSSSSPGASQSMADFNYFTTLKMVVTRYIKQKSSSCLDVKMQKTDIDETKDPSIA